MAVATNIQVCATVASMVDGIDLGIFPSSFKALEAELFLSPSQLGRLSMMGGLASCFCMVLWGFLADNFNRKSILVRATAGLSVATLATSCAHSYRGLAGTRVMAAMFAAATTPITQCLIAQSVPSTSRGGAFALTAVASSIASAVAAYLPAVLSWRSAYVAMGLATGGLALGLHIFMADVEPEIFHTMQTKVGGSLIHKLTAESRKVKSLFCIPTFLAILCGGIFGCIPWNALQFLMMYFQTIGFSGIQAGTLVSIGALGRTIGCFFGGHLGDKMAALSPMHGRAFVAQGTIVLGMAALYVILKVVPPSPEYFKTFAAANLAFGLVACWCNPAVDRPLWSEIVPSNCRGTVISWWSMIAGTFGNIFGAPLVGFLAERVYGYSLTAHDPHKIDPANVQALSSALLICTMVPWVFCFGFYSLIHITYRSDCVHSVGGSETSQLSSRMAA